MRGRTMTLNEERRDGARRREPPVEPAQRQREEPDARVDGLTLPFGGRHEAASFQRPAVVGGARAGFAAFAYLSYQAR